MLKRFHGKQFWACSIKGRMLVEKWKESRKNDERIAAIRCHSALLNGQLEEACVAMKEHQESHWLSKDAKQCDLNLELETRILVFHALEKSRISEMKDAGIMRVEILGADSAEICQICRAASGKIYPIDCAPILPHEDCTCKDGCMCMVIAKK